MTTYFVSAIIGSDSNSGTSTGSAFLTLQAAANKTLPSDTVEVMNGTYASSSSFVLDITRSGTAAAPITFEAMAGNHPVIDSSGNWAGIQIDGASYINVSGFEVQGGAKNVTLAYAQSKASTTSDPLTAGNGILVNGLSRSSHITISGNTVHDVPGGGITSIHADYISVLNNTVYGTSNWSPYGTSGISVGFAYQADGSTGYHNYIVGNKSFNNKELIPFHAVGKITDGNGIIVDSNGSGYTARTLVENNLSYNNGGSGIHTLSSDHVDIVYNTAYMNDQNIANGEIASYYSSDVNILNNVMVASAGKPVDNSPEGQNVTYDYNVYFGGAGTPSVGAHSITADPLFTSPDTGDFSLQAGSPALDSATSSFKPISDILGNPRPVGAGYDRGAFERSTGSGLPSPPSTSADVVTGNGSDTLTLRMSEDAYQGDAQFTVTVDGRQLSGIFGVTASHATGATQSFAFEGDWAPGAHSIAITFVNDLYGGTTTADRNLYVDGISYDSMDTSQSASMVSAGSKGFSFTDATAIPSPATGSGSDTLILRMSETAYQGDAQFTVSMDGKQVGGSFSATASHAAGASQDFTFKGDFGAGQHSLSVNFINDLYGGTAAKDRNLYVDAISYRGANTNQSASLVSTGPVVFSVSGGTTPAVSETGDHGLLQKNLSQVGTYQVGGDRFILSAANSVAVTLGTGTSELKFIGPGSVTLTGGSGQTAIVADTGTNTFVAGAGSMDVTGGGGRDAYTFHATSGLLTIRDFSLSKGDTLAIDKSLQSSLQQISDGRGGIMLAFGVAGHGVDISGLASLPTTSVHWV